MGQTIAFCGLPVGRCPAVSAHRSSSRLPKHGDDLEGLLPAGSDAVESHALQESTKPGELRIPANSG